MAVGVCWGIVTQDGSLPEITEAFSNHYPAGKLPIFPCLCVTIACGAVSGFHATQSPLMARCLNNEKNGRFVFYGAMITEGIVALIWAAGAIKFADGVCAAGVTPYEKLLNLMTENGAHSADPAILVNAVCSTWLGSVGAVLAVLGVVAAPITSGDTAFRSARLIASDFLHVKQGSISNRLLLALPLFGIATYLFFVDFQILWRYFAWFNQTLACVALWAFTAWVTRRGATNGKRYDCLVTLVPALWMTLVSVTYICVAPEGFTLSTTISYAIGTVCTLALLVSFMIWEKRLYKK